MSRRPSILLALAATLAALMGGLLPASRAQGAANWPVKPIRMVIAFAPGGPTDLVSRVLAQRLSEQLGQAVVVENKPGAGGNLAAEIVATAAPDGYSSSVPACTARSTTTPSRTSPQSA